MSRNLCLSSLVHLSHLHHCSCMYVASLIRAAHRTQPVYHLLTYPACRSAYTWSDISSACSMESVALQAFLLVPCLSERVMMVKGSGAP